MEPLTLSLFNESNVLDTGAFQPESYQALLTAVSNGEAEYAQSLGWLQVEEWAGEEWLSRYEAVAARVQANADVLVVVGIGGSNQGARAVIDCIGSKSTVDILWAGNTISAHSMNAVLAQLEGKRVYINVIAKNFETLEPGIAFRVLRNWLRKAYGDDYASHIICTGSVGSHFEDLCKTHGYTFLPFPHNIGGRFTALSPIGLLPMAVAGLDIRAMARGAQEMRSCLTSGAPAENMALQFAWGRNTLFQKGYRMEMLSFFEPRLLRFSRWWMQLFGESEGKDSKGLYPLTGNFSEDLHSIGQFIQDGTPILYEVFLDVARKDAACPLGTADIDDRFQYLDGSDFHEINRAAFQATLTAHSQRFPCYVVTLPALDEASFGQLFYFFEFVCYLSARMLGVNPFDQPGVEAYKHHMFKILGK